MHPDQRALMAYDCLRDLAFLSTTNREDNFQHRARSRIGGSFRRERVRQL